MLEPVWVADSQNVLKRGDRTNSADLAETGSFLDSRLLPYANSLGPRETLDKKRIYELGVAVYDDLRGSGNRLASRSRCLRVVNFSEDKSPISRA